MMVEQLVSLWTLIFILDHLFHVLRKPIFMALCSSNSAPSPSPLTWKRLSQSPVFASKKVRDIPRGSLKEESLSSSLKLISEALGVGKEEGFDQEKSDECVVAKATPMPPAAPAARRLWKRPVKIVIPPNGGGDGGSGFGESGFRREEDVGREMEVEGSDYCLASKRGTRHMMEDGYGVITNINGDSKQAFFGVFDGHGGRAAVDFISDKLGKNIISYVDEIKEEDGENSMTMAIKTGYLTTDSEFLHKGLSSGACAATVLLKNGEMHVSNVGDCRIVMSRNGLAEALTTDHRPGREDERIRIENLGGYVNCHNGVWRVQDSLAISRSIGDANMKEWIVSEPETKRIPLTQDCEFLIIASDGLWDKVSNQEAVDLVGKMRKSIQSCKDLVEVSCSRGNRDDITVMVVDIRSFCRAG